MFILTHAVNFPCERKPEKTHDFRQSVDRLFSHETTHESIARLEPTISEMLALTTAPCMLNSMGEMQHSIPASATRAPKHDIHENEKEREIFPFHTARDLPKFCLQTLYSKILSIPQLFRLVEIFGLFIFEMSV